MANIRDIRQRITSVRDIQHITRAMKMVSVAKLHRAEMAARRARTAGDCLEEILVFVHGKMPRFRHPLLEERKGPALLIAVASDKGLCGGYNSRVLSRAKSLTGELGAGTKLIVIGKRLVSMCRSSGIAMCESLEGLSASSSTRYARELAIKARRLFDKGEISRVVVLFNPYKRGLGRATVEECLVPLRIPDKAERPGEGNYLYEPRLDLFMGMFLNMLLACRIQAILIESQLSEQLARMQAMENASQNATDLIAELTLMYNKARQSIITNEIIDIVGGAEALRAG